MKSWRCSICGFMFDGDSAPDVCPDCGAGADAFEAE